MSIDSHAKQLWNSLELQQIECNTPSTYKHTSSSYMVSPPPPQSSLAPFVHRRKPDSKEEREPQCVDIPSPKHSPSSSVSSQLLLVVCLNGGRRSTCALLEYMDTVTLSQCLTPQPVSSSTFRRPLTDYLCPFLLASLLLQSHAINTRCRRPQTAPRGIGPCQGFGRHTRWKYSHRHLLHL